MIYTLYLHCLCSFHEFCTHKLLCVKLDVDLIENFTLGMSRETSGVPLDAELRYVRSCNYLGAKLERHNVSNLHKLPTLHIS